jgi:hypothetical protein
MKFEIVLLALFCVGVAGNVHSEEDAHANLIAKQEGIELKRVTNLFDLPPFFVGSIHRDWVLTHERGPLKVGQRALNHREGCTAFDVGMNDGFFTQFSAAHGCKVWSFELQEACIKLSTDAAAMNNFTHLVTITRAPVANEDAHPFQVSPLPYVPSRLFPCPYAHMPICPYAHMPIQYHIPTARLYWLVDNPVTL